MGIAPYQRLAGRLAKAVKHLRQASAHLTEVRPGAREAGVSPAPVVASAVDTLTLSQLPAKARAAAQASRERLLGKFPTLDEVVRDPDAFVADIRARFTAQQQLTPTHPYRFDFSDYGIPVLKQWRGMLREEAAEVQGRKLSHLGKVPMGSVREHDTALQLIDKLKREIDGHINRGRISYERLQELADYVSRAMGRFDGADMMPNHRVLLRMDEALQGVRPSTAAQELTRYQKNRHQKAFFDGEKVHLDNGTSADARFVAEKYDPRRLNMVVLPTSEPLNDEVFERTSARQIYLDGVTREPILADGINRPSKLFREHDLRHNQAIHTLWMDYAQKHNLTPGQTKALQAQADVWREELRQWKEAIQDSRLRKAVDLVDFSTYHDRGFPSVPSSFDPPTRDKPYILWGLLASEKFGGQEVGFSNPKLMDQAYASLREFWQARKPQEEAILKASI